MLDLAHLPTTFSLRSRELAALHSFLVRMRACGTAYETDCATSVIAPASDLHLGLSSEDDLLAMVVDLPRRLRPYIAAWARCAPSPDCYEGTWQELLTCLRFEAPNGASLCVDFEALSEPVLDGQWGTPRMLLCLACGDEVTLTLLDASLLAQQEFTAKLFDLFRTAAEARASLYYSLRKGYAQVDAIDRPQGLHEPVWVVPWVLGLNQVRTAALKD